MTNVHSRDDGDIVLGWLTRMVVVLALLGLAAFDVVAVAVGHIGAQDDASTAAAAASEAYHAKPTAQHAYDAAVAALSGKSDRIPTSTFRVDRNGTVHLQVRREITTLVAYRIPPLRRFTEAVASAQDNSTP